MTQLNIQTVAERLLGKPKSLTATEMRYGNRGSLSIDLTKGLFHDFESSIGGDAIDLIKQTLGCDFPEAKLWYEATVGDFLIRQNYKYPPPTTAPPEEHKNYQKVLSIWDTVRRDDSLVAGHPYCKRKRIEWAFGAGRTTVGRSPLGFNRDCIVIPIRKNGVGDVVAIQLIDADDRKDGKVNYGQLKGNFLLLGNTRDHSLLCPIVEGWASAHSLVDRYGYEIVAIAFGIHQLQSVGEQLQRDRKVVIVEEDDGY